MGKYCEFRASNHCDAPIVISESDALRMFDPETKLVNDEEIPFCVNHGVCYQVDAKDEYYCLCGQEAGYELWTGKRCEVPILPAGSTTAPTVATSKVEIPTLDPPPTVDTKITEPTASVPFVKCGNLECRYEHSWSRHDFFLRGAISMYFSHFGFSSPARAFFLALSVTKEMVVSVSKATITKC